MNLRKVILAVAKSRRLMAEVDELMVKVDEADEANNKVKADKIMKKARRYEDESCRLIEQFEEAGDNCPKIYKWLDENWY